MTCWLTINYTTGKAEHMIQVEPVEIKQGKEFKILSSMLIYIQTENDQLIYIEFTVEWSKI